MDIHKNLQNLHVCASARTRVLRGFIWPWRPRQGLASGQADLYEQTWIVWVGQVDFYGLNQGFS